MCCLCCGASSRLPSGGISLNQPPEVRWLKKGMSILQKGKIETIRFEILGGEHKFSVSMPFATFAKDLKKMQQLDVYTAISCLMKEEGARIAKQSLLQALKAANGRALFALQEDGVGRVCLISQGKEKASRYAAAFFHRILHEAIQESLSPIEASSEPDGSISSSTNPLVYWRTPTGSDGSSLRCGSDTGRSGGDDDMDGAAGGPTARKLAHIIEEIQAAEMSATIAATK